MMFRYIQQKLSYSICNPIKNTGIFTAVETGLFTRPQLMTSKVELNTQSAK